MKVTPLPGSNIQSSDAISDATEYEAIRQLYGNQSYDAAIASKPRPTLIKKRFDIREEKSVNPKGSVYRHVDDGVAIFSSWASANIQVTLWNFRSRDPGRYRFRISGYGFQTEKPVTFHVMAGTLTEATQQHLVGYYEVPAKMPTVVEFVERLETKNTIRIVVDGLGVIPTVVEKIGVNDQRLPLGEVHAGAGALEARAVRLGG